MGKLFPPFKVDIAGALCVPFTLRDARSRYQHGQISLSALRAIENKYRGCDRWRISEL